MGERVTALVLTVAFGMTATPAQAATPSPAFFASHRLAPGVSALRLWDSGTS